jgi:hypothetical protein
VTREQVKTMLAYMTTVYTARLMPEVTATVIDVWWELLQDIPFELAEPAIKKLASTERFPPTIADIRAAVTHVPEEDTSAEEAWSKMYGAILKFGVYGKEDAEQYLGKLWEFVGKEWRYYCTMLEDQVPNEKARFINMYKAYAKKAKYMAQIPETVRQRLEAYHSQGVGKALLNEGEKQ